MNELDKIKERIAKLIRHRDSAEKLGNLQEAESFAEKIQDLALKYGVEIANLNWEDQEQMNKPLGTEIDLTKYMRRHESDWIMKLFKACARGNMCRFVTNKARTWCDIIGYSHNVEIAIYLAESLIPRLRLLARKEFKAYQGYEKRNTFIRGFLQSADQAIEERLTLKIEEAQVNSTQITALVRTTEIAVNNFMRTKYPRLGSIKDRSL